MTVRGDYPAGPNGDVACPVLHPRPHRSKLMSSSDVNDSSVYGLPIAVMAPPRAVSAHAVATAS
jgi:hypothetical protein